jgi:ketosteroid isomerase-like protein
MDDLHDRLARIEDERAIVAILYRYGDALDHGDRDEFLDCFTPDAQYLVHMRMGSSDGLAFEGHEQLREYFDRHTHAPAAQSYFLRVDSPAAGPAVVLAAGRYIDHLERSPEGRWRIRSRRCEVENL